jgi:hypothetical protein
MGSAPAGFEGAPEGPVQFEGCGSRLTDGWATSRAKTFGGTVIRPDLGELVRLIVISAGHVVELDAVELVFEGPHGLAV